MIRFRRSLVSVHVLVVLLLATFSSGWLRSQAGGTLNGHPVRLDATGNLLAWTPVQAVAYNQVLGWSTNFLLNGVPTGSNGLKLYYSESYANPGNPSPGPAGRTTRPGLYSMLTDSGLAYYAYSGNVAMANLVRDVLTYQLDHGMTPIDVALAGRRVRQRRCRRASPIGAPRPAIRPGVGDGVGVIQPDKVGEIGVAFLDYYEFSGDTRFRDAAVQAADVLASHVRPGMPPGRRGRFACMPRPTSIREQYSAHVISPIRLFDELIRLNLGNVAAYRDGPANRVELADDVSDAEQRLGQLLRGRGDHVQIRSNVNQLNAGETARYLMQHPEFDPELGNPRPGHHRVDREHVRRAAVRRELDCRADGASTIRWAATRRATPPSTRNSTS